MAFVVLTKKYENGGISSSITETPSIRVNYKREFGRFVAYYSYAWSIEEAEKIKKSYLEDGKL